MEKTLIDSADYLAKLEARLARMKSIAKDPSPKEMLFSLQQARESYLSVNVSHENQQSSFLSEGSDGDKHLTSTYLERYVFPEKQALTVEEVQLLLQHDTLARATAEIEEKEQNTEKSLER